MSCNIPGCTNKSKHETEGKGSKMLCIEHSLRVLTNCNNCNKKLSIKPFRYIKLVESNKRILCLSCSNSLHVKPNQKITKKCKRCNNIFQGYYNTKYCQNCILELGNKCRICNRKIGSFSKLLCDDCYKSTPGNGNYINQCSKCGLYYKDSHNGAITKSYCYNCDKCHICGFIHAKNNIRFIQLCSPSKAVQAYNDLKNSKNIILNNNKEFAIYPIKENTENFKRLRYFGKSNCSKCGREYNKREHNHTSCGHCKEVFVCKHCNLKYINIQDKKDRGKLYCSRSCVVASQHKNGYLKSGIQNESHAKLLRSSSSSLFVVPIEDALKIIDQNKIQNYNSVMIYKYSEYENLINNEKPEFGFVRLLYPEDDLIYSAQTNARDYEKHIVKSVFNGTRKSNYMKYGITSMKVVWGFESNEERLAVEGFYDNIAKISLQNG